jgi:hypothetical protein
MSTIVETLKDLNIFSDDIVNYCIAPYLFRTEAQWKSEFDKVMVEHLQEMGPWGSKNHCKKDYKKWKVKQFIEKRQLIEAGVWELHQKRNLNYRYYFLMGEIKEIGMRNYLDVEEKNCYEAIRYFPYLKDSPLCFKPVILQYEREYGGASRTYHRIDFSVHPRPRI